MSEYCVLCVCVCVCACLVVPGATVGALGMDDGKSDNG